MLKPVEVSKNVGRPRSTRVAFLALAAALSLSACGGGGGDGSGAGVGPQLTAVPGGSLALTQVNAQEVASGAMALIELPGFVDIARQLSGLFSARMGPESSNGSYMCPGGGSASWTRDIVSGPPAVNDSISITYANCVLPYPSNPMSMFTVHGDVGVFFTDVSGNFLLSAPWSYTAQIVFHDFQIAANGTSATLAGTLNLASSTSDGVNISGNLSGPSFSATIGMNRIGLADFSIDFTENSTTNAYKISGRSEIFFSGSLMGTATVETGAPIAGTDPGDPTSGTLRIVGSNAVVTLSALNAMVARISLDEAGDGSVEWAKNVAWAGL